MIKTRSKGEFMSKKYTEEEIRILAHSSIGKTFGELQEMDVKTVKSEDYDENTEVFNKAFLVIYLKIMFINMVQILYLLLILKMLVLN